jgi:hypothetical protein
MAVVVAMIHHLGPGHRRSHDHDGHVHDHMNL